MFDNRSLARKATAAPVPAVQAGFDADATDLMRMDSDKG
jgi:hypothetical protein